MKIGHYRKYVRGSDACCARCAYWDAPEVANRLGQCRRHCPSSDDGWPLTPPQGWCGDFPDFANGIRDVDGDPMPPLHRTLPVMGSQ